MLLDNDVDEEVIVDDDGDDTPDAVIVFSLTFGTCCINTSGVNFLGDLRRFPPLPGPHPYPGTGDRIKNVKTMTDMTVNDGNDVEDGEDCLVLDKLYTED